MADNHIQITTRSAAQTRKLGHCLGSAIHQATVIALTGDLGSGKTAFVQGLAKGLNVSEKYYITSPTFTIINEYPGRLCLFHVDLYRIAHLAELEEIGLEEILREDAVIAIEWAQKLPADALTDHFELRFNMIGANTRRIEVFAYGHPAVNLLRTLEIQFKDL